MKIRKNYEEIFDYLLNSCMCNGPEETLWMKINEGKENLCAVHILKYT